MSTMEIHVEERKHQILFFEKLLNETSSQIDRILFSVGWSREYIVNEACDMAHCSLNIEHTVPKTSLNTHIQSCSWHKGGYHELDIPLPENMSHDGDKTKSSLTLESSLQACIIKQAKKECEFLVTGNPATLERPIPQTSDRLVSDFTSNERLILYDYVIANTRPAGGITVADVQMMGELTKNETPRPKSKLEYLIEQRDAKRRRISYRKKIHTNRKTHTEILREVIQNQMELLEQIMKGECHAETDKILSEEHEESVENEEVMSVEVEEKASGFVVRSEEYEGKYDENRSFSVSYGRRSFARRCESHKESNRSHCMKSRSRSKESRERSDKRRSKSRYSYEQERNQGDSYCRHRKHFNMHKDHYRNEQKRKEESHYKHFSRNQSMEHKIDIEYKNSRSSKYSPPVHQSDGNKANVSEENYKGNQYFCSKNYENSHRESANVMVSRKELLHSNVDKNKVDKLYLDQSTFELQKLSESSKKKSKKKKSCRHKSKSKKKKKKVKKYSSSETSDSCSIHGSEFLHKFN